MARSSFKSFLSRWHPSNGKEYISNLYTTFGAPFFYMMMSSYIGVKGAIYYFTYFVQLPYYRTAGLDGSVQQQMYAVSYVPWTTKGFIGVVSDLLPLFGYQKTTYMVIYTILGSIGLLSTAILPLSVANKNPIIPALLMLLSFLQSAGSDLLMEGKYAQQMNKLAGSKPNIVTFSWFCTLTGQLLPSVLVGPVSDAADPRILFYVFTPFALQPLIPIYYGGIVDDKVPSGENNRINVKRFKAEWRVMTLATAMGLGSLGTVFIAIFSGSSTVQIVYSFGIAAVMSIWSFFMIPRVIACFIVYHFISMSFYVNLQGALEYFYTADIDCVENGPRFSFTFLRTYGQIAGTCAQILGLFIFQIILSKWKFRHIYWSTTLVRICAAVFDIVLVERWNLIIGIPDEVAYLFGYAVVIQLTYMMDFLPNIIMIAKLCPRNVEATMFAMLAGYGNYGENTGTHLGVFLMKVFNIQTVVTDQLSCNFQNLTYMVIFGHIFLPALCIPLAFILIPNAYLSEKLITNIESNKTEISKISEVDKPAH